MKSEIMVGLVAVSASAFAAPINLNSSTYSQDFNTLATSGTANSWVNGSTIQGWYLLSHSTPATAITSYRAGTGSATSGGFYSFGNSSDRALGGLGSGSVSGWIAAQFINQSGGAFNSFTAQWAGEQWRNAGNTSPQTMTFQYGFGDSFDAVSWQTPGGNFDWASPLATSVGGALDGNAAGRVNNVGGTITGLDWVNGQSLWLRWVETDDLGPDHALAIDDFSLSAKAPRAAAISAVPDTLPLMWSVITVIGLLAGSRRFAQC